MIACELVAKALDFHTRAIDPDLLAHEAALYLASYSFTLAILGKWNEGEQVLIIKIIKVHEWSNSYY